MKLSDYVVKFLEGKTDSIFLLSGGGIMHLVDSLGRSKKLGVVCTHHEQAAAIAAEGYARIKNDVGVVVVTTGPGGTNAVTGVAGAWLDSIPMLVISGQVKTDNITPRKNGVPVVRAIGFQELNITDIVRPITKYVVTIENKEDIGHELEKAVYIAKSGRPGPVWVEIPLDLQAQDVEPNKLKSFKKPAFSKFIVPIKEVVKELELAKKPLLMVGNGIRLANGAEILNEWIKKVKTNVVSSIFTADDIVTEDYSYYLGRQGMPGNETANWAVDNCDLLLVIGERLQLTQTSYEYQNFATQATKIMVDIDNNELHKKTLKIDIPILCDAKLFLQKLNKANIKLNRWNVSRKLIDIDNYKGNKNYVNPYKAIDEINSNNRGLTVATSNGMASLVPHQAIKMRNGQRFITNAGLGNMGSGLPLAIGACIAENKRPVICMEGDGSLMLNIQELETVKYNNLPIKLFIFNNGGYHSIRNTHLNYFNKIFAADQSSGLSIPNFQKLIEGWGIRYIGIHNDEELNKIKEIMEYKGLIVCELFIDPYQKMLPKWTAGQFRNKK